MVVLKEYRATFSGATRTMIISVAETITDQKLRTLVLDFGIGYHHAGLCPSDRSAVEKLFANNHLAVLTCTSTLAQGVNLPAELVIIKSTLQMFKGGWKEYGEAQILQMAGRAGRPQHCTSATVVIMTESSKKNLYERLIGGSQRVESNLHNHLHEHLNSEIILGTIKSVSDAVEWMKASFLYVRMQKNPARYAVVESNGDQFNLDQHLYDLCKKALEDMGMAEVVTMEDNGKVSGTSLGRVMSRYYLAFATMKNFSTLSGDEDISQILNIIVDSKEFSDTVLRVGEKKILNELNSGKQSKIRFKLEGKIKTPAMKVNVLIQAILGVISITDPGLGLEAPRLLQLASRISLALLGYVNNSRRLKEEYKLVCTCLNLDKSLRSGIWENSAHIAKQIDRVGMVIANHLVAAGLITFPALAAANPREIEMVCSKCPPFGNSVRAFAQGIPQYRLNVTGILTGESSFQVTANLSLMNLEDYQESGEKSVHQNWNLVLGNGRKLMHRIHGLNNFILNAENYTWQKNFIINRRDCTEGFVEISLIHDSIIGVDVTSVLKLPWIIISQVQEDVSSGILPGGGRQPLPDGLPDEFYEHQMSSQTNPYQSSFVGQQGYEQPNEWGQHQMNTQPSLGQRQTNNQPDDLPDEWYEHQMNTLDNPGSYQDPMAFDYDELNELPDERYENPMSAQQLLYSRGKFHGQQNDNDWNGSNFSGSVGGQQDYVANYSRSTQPKYNTWNVPDPGNNTWNAPDPGKFDYQSRQYFEEKPVRGQHYGGSGEQFEETWQTTSQLGTSWMDQSEEVNELDETFENDGPSTSSKLSFVGRSEVYRSCKHPCANKQSCAHKCCKIGTKVKDLGRMSSSVRSIKNHFYKRGSRTTGCTRGSWSRPSSRGSWTRPSSLQQFAYTPRRGALSSSSSIGAGFSGGERNNRFQTQVSSSGQSATPLSTAFHQGSNYNQRESWQSTSSEAGPTQSSLTFGAAGSNSTAPRSSFGGSTMFSSTPRSVESATRSFGGIDASCLMAPASPSSFGRGMEPCMPPDVSEATTDGTSRSYFSDITNIYKD